MSIFVFAFYVSVAALVAYNVFSYLEATGTPIERLSAAWKNSSTIFVLAWGGILSFAVSGLDLFAQVTGDPQFSTISDTVKAYIPPQYQPLIPVGVVVAGILARTRTLGK
jgi:hypothetical protein